MAGYAEPVWLSAQINLEVRGRDRLNQMMPELIRHQHLEGMWEQRKLLTQNQVSCKLHQQLNII
jgi:hypothetical protein